MRTELNCPNCGAPITGELCRYCGTAFYDWGTIDTQKPRYIKLKVGSSLILAKAKMDSFNLISNMQPMRMYADDKVVMCQQSEQLQMECSFTIEPVDGVLYRNIDTDVCNIPTAEMIGEHHDH